MDEVTLALEKVAYVINGFSHVFTLSRVGSGLIMYPKWLLYHDARELSDSHPVQYKSWLNIYMLN